MTVERTPDAARALPLTSAGAGVALALLTQVHAMFAPYAVAVLGVALIAASWRGEIDLTRKPHALEWAALAFVAVWALTAFLARDPERARALVIPVLMFVLIVVLIARSARWSRIDANAVLVALAMTSVAQALSVFIALGDFGGDPSRAVAASASPWLVVPNDVAWIAIVWPLGYAACRARTLPWRIAASLLAALHVALFVAVQSRLAMACALLVVLALAPSRRKAFGIAALALFAIVPTLALIASPIAAKGIESLHARVQLWQAATALGAEHPLVGIGPGGFADAYLPHLPSSPVDSRITPWPHSLPLEAWAEQGMPGVLALLALLACAARALAGMTNRRVAIAIATAAALFPIVEGSALRVYFWMLTALAVGVLANLGERVRGQEAGSS